MFNNPNKRGKITENEFILYSTQQCLIKNVHIIITNYILVALDFLLSPFSITLQNLQKFLFLFI
jgi:hypothetical protein